MPGVMDFLHLKTNGSSTIDAMVILSPLKRGGIFDWNGHFQFSSFGVQ